MTVQLDWPPDVVNRFIDEARRKGLSLADDVLQTVLQQKTLNGTASANDATSRQAREEAGQSIRELCKGNVLGPGLTVRDLVEEGRRF